MQSSSVPEQPCSSPNQERTRTAPSGVTCQFSALRSIQLRRKGRLALHRGHREVTALRYKVGWVGSRRETVSGKLSSVSQVCDVANGVTPEFISQFDSFLPGLSQCSQLDYLCSGFQER